MVKMWEEKQVPKFFLRLFQMRNGVELQIVDEKGVPAVFGTVATINNSGILCLHTSIQNSIAREAGIQLDEDGKIKIQKW